MGPDLPAITAAPQHKPVPTTHSAVPDLRPCSYHPRSSPRLSFSSSLLPLQPIFFPTVARGSTILDSHSSAQNPSMAPHCPKLSSYAWHPTLRIWVPSPSPAPPHFPLYPLNSSSLFSKPMPSISISGSFPRLLLISTTCACPVPPALQGRAQPKQQVTEFQFVDIPGPLRILTALITVCPEFLGLEDLSSSSTDWTRVHT